MGDLGLLPAVNTLAFLLCVVFLSYVTMIVVAYLREGPHAAGDPTSFAWHVLVPCLDEARVVRRSVERMLADLPQVHVWCIDDASTDDTLAILRSLEGRSPRVHVVARTLPEARQGKGEALNAGWAAIRAWVPATTDRASVLVGVVDADGELDVGALRALSGPDYFADPTVGAVQLAVRIANRSTGHHVRTTGWARQLLVDLQDVEFIGPIAGMQLLRRRSASVSMGGNGQFTRLSILDDIASWAGTPWHGALLEDFELGLHVLLSGMRTAYCHHSAVSQEGLSSLRLLVRQRSRWAQGSMQCAQYLRPVMASTRVGNLAAFEICYFLLMPWIQLVGTVIYVFAYLILVWYLATVGLSPGAWIDSGQWGVLPLLFLGGIGPFFIWGPLYRRRTEPATTRRRAVVLGFASWIYSNLHYVATWWAFARVLADRDDWKKSERVSGPSAEAPAVAP
ncbi:glycosyltransferase [Aquihabitans sp. G128]|uniref:glycosyltransferase family 2 protein n=1 Tax=Aquihabitans sp. G128 TaxID=2849779 RepID=UPI001C21346F|nr:glycosyltransferase [Aquihabitans sp. G128]QXC59958.1 glycosyltransferase [Aquihabitans sp. G128]